MEHNMKDWLARIFGGRQGMDELSKTLFWTGIMLFALAVLAAGVHIVWLAGILQWLSIFLLIYSFFRAFSRNLPAREAENMAFFAFRARQQQKRDAAKERHRQSKEYKFFRCPGCKTWLRVPKGKGKIHIKCKCGYMLYRKT